MSMYIGQSNVTAAEAVGQLLVVDPEQVQHGGVEIMYLQWLIHRLVTPIIGCAIGHAGLDPAPGHPKAEAVLVVIPAFRAMSTHSSASNFWPA
jgi:hypothetical protein